jgi:hypothetical protein
MVVVFPTPLTPAIKITHGLFFLYFLNFFREVLIFQIYNLKKFYKSHLFPDVFGFTFIFANFSLNSFAD